MLRFVKSVIIRESRMSQRPSTWILLIGHATVPGDVVEDQCWRAGVRVLEGCPHTLTHSLIGHRLHDVFVFVLGLVVTLSLGVLSSPALTHDKTPMNIDV